MNPEKKARTTKGKYRSMTKKLLNVERVVVSVLASTILGATLPACAPEIHVLRVGIPAQPRPPGCALELRAELTAEEQAAHQYIGTIVIMGDPGEHVSSPRILALVKPDACKLGAELLVAGSSHDSTNAYGTVIASQAMYAAYRRRTGASQVTKF